MMRLDFVETKMEAKYDVYRAEGESRLEDAYGMINWIKFPFTTHCDLRTRGLRELKQSGTKPRRRNLVNKACYLLN